MKKLFVSYEIAKQLKEKGFDEECFCYYDEGHELNLKSGRSFGGIMVQDCHQSNIIAPLYQQVIDWLREKHNIDIWVSPFTLENLQGKLNCPNDTKSYSYFILKNGKWVADKCNFNDYYSALDEVITEALKLI